MAKSVTVIPAEGKTKKGKDKKSGTPSRHLRVAAYCRVSTDQEEQLNSFENQVEYYTNYINTRPEYEMAGIYADEGISGTNTKKRKEFQRMISDCEAGKIDLVITKSISRFARNTQDCLSYSRKLRDLGIGIIFEKEHINTMDATGELLFTILSSLAQDESRNISENCKWGIRSKFKKGIPHINTNRFTGFDKDAEGRLVINEGQAKTVRRIFKEFLEGGTCEGIARGLNADGIPTASGGDVRWVASTIKGMLENEKYKGDALLQKYYTKDFLTKKLARNDGQIDQYYVKDSHPAIVPGWAWEAAQMEERRREEYVAEHRLKSYSYGAERPLSKKVTCGTCGGIYTRKSWASRGICYWQCGGKKDGRPCPAPRVSDDALCECFVTAWNTVVGGRDALVPKWEEMKSGENPLLKVRAMQMEDLTAEGRTEAFIPELAMAVLGEIKVMGGGRFLVRFLDGTEAEVMAGEK